MADNWRRSALAIAGLLFAVGCVERQMHITSEPDGATVVINQTVRGQTPFTYPFRHYGTYDIILEKPGYYPLHVAEPIAAPLYEQPGLDLISEAALPARIKDYRHLHYRLAPIGDPDAKEEILDRQEEMKKRSAEIAARRKARDEAYKPIQLPLKEKPQPEKKTTTTDESEQPKKNEPSQPQAAETARGPEL